MRKAQTQVDTKLLYLFDSYQREMRATVLEILPEPAKKLRVRLDRSVFCPDGGGGKANKRGGTKGQPTDTGQLLWEGTAGLEPQAAITQVIVDQAELWHFLEPLSPDDFPLLQVGQMVVGKLDWERRYGHMRTHTAAYLLHYALFEADLLPATLTPIRCDYGPHPFVVYRSSGPVPVKLDLSELEARLATLVAQNLSLRLDPPGSERLTQSEVSLQLDNLKSLVLNTESEGVGFGTLLNNTGEVGSVRLLEAEQWVEDQIKISYQLTALH